MIYQLCDNEAPITAELQRPTEILRPREIELQAAPLINVPASRQSSAFRLLHPQQTATRVSRRSIKRYHIT